MNEFSNLILVSPLAEGRVRLDVFLSRSVEGLSRTKAKEMIDSGLVRVNGKQASSKQMVQVGDQVSFSDPPRTVVNLEPIPMKLDVVFEDNSLIVVNKQAGVAVHPGAGETGPTLVHGLLHHCSTLGRGSSNDDDDNEDYVRPGIVHRLDKDTTGLLVVAKTDAAHAYLSKQFQDKTNLRQYVALLNGPFPEGQWIRDSYLYRDPKERTRFASMDVTHYEHKKSREGFDHLPGYRLARSMFKREAQFNGMISLVSIKLFTGRTHQIRVHAQDLGAPVLGDPVYGRKFMPRVQSGFSPEVESEIMSLNRQMLHAWILGFKHPDSGEWMQFETPLPQDFASVVKNLAPWRDPDGDSKANEGT